MKLFLTFLFAATVLFYGCSDEKLLPEPEPEPGEQPPPDPGTEPKDNPYITGVDLSLESLVKYNYGETDEYYLLGYGYDATGRFAHPGFVRKKVIEVGILEQELGGTVTIIKGNSSQQDYYFWGPEEECREDFSVHADFSDEEIKKYPNLFKESVIPVFSHDNVFPELDYTYYGYSSIIVNYRMTFMWLERRHAEHHLSEEFRTALENLTADEIIQEFGTHVITGLKKGARLDMYYRSTSSDFNDNHDWVSYYSNFYLDLGNEPREPDIDRPLKDNIYFEFVYDGKSKSNAFLIDILNYKGGKVAFEGMNSFEEEKATLVGFNKKPIPIYEMVIDSEKKEEIKDAFERSLGLEY